MKKLFYTFPILALILAPAVSFGAVSYTRTPSGPDVASPVFVSVIVDDFDVDINTTSEPGMNYWSVLLNGNTNDSVYSSCVPSSTLSISVSLSAPVGDTFGSVEAELWGDPSCVPGNGTTGAIFETGLITIISGSGPVIGFPPVIAPLTTRLTDTLTDPGLLAVIAFVISVPVVFWVIGRIRKLFPSPDPKDPTK